MEDKKEPIILYREVQKIGGSHYLNVTKSEMDFHNWTDGTKLKITVERINVEE